jgi:hypothetical protein
LGIGSCFTVRLLSTSKWSISKNLSLKN